MKTQDYFKLMEMETRRVYAVAEEARKKGLDLSYRSMYMGHSRADTTRKFYDWISTKEEMMKFKEAFPG